MEIRGKHQVDPGGDTGSESHPEKSPDSANNH